MKRTRVIVTAFAVCLFAAACLPIFAQGTTPPTGGKFGLPVGAARPSGLATSASAPAPATNNTSSPAPSSAPPPQGPAVSKELLPGAIIKSVTAEAVGAKQGQLGRGAIPCTKYEFQPAKSIDSATGMPTGARKLGPITITKRFDAASIPLLDAFSTNETLNTVTLTFMGGEASMGAGGLKPVITVKLTNATITSIHQLYDKDGLAEEVTFAFNKIDISDSKSAYSDSWTTR